MFIGREHELNKLNEVYLKEQFEFAVIYGRRRIGKTTLINKFCEKKKAIYYMAIEGTANDNLERFSRAIFDVIMPGQVMPAFKSYEELFSYVDSIVNERIVIAIDEYPYLAEGNKPLSSILQAHIDQKWKNSKLFFILSGSSMSFMEEQVLGYKSPLYGRRTCQFKLMPFTFFEAIKGFENFSVFEQALLYGVTGGIPEYMRGITSDVSVDKNIMELFFDSSGRLFEEPTNLMKQELRNFSIYNSVISAIADGASRMNDISTKVGEDSAACSAQVRNLISLGVIKKEIPSLEPATSKKTIYSLEDTMFLFWYRFVLPNSSNISKGLGKSVYNSIVKPQLNDFMGTIFEKICIQYMYKEKVFENAPFFYGNLSRWWGNNPKLKKQEEIDILGGDKDNILLGECKWTNDKVNIRVYRDLEEQSKLFHQKNKFFYLFAKNGFTKDIKDVAKNNKNIKLISIEEMLK